MNSVRIIAADSREWAEWLEDTPHDFYHTSEYHRFSRDQGEGQPFLAVYGNRDRFVAWPYLLRNLGSQWIFQDLDSTDIGSVYGYPGPVCRGCQPGDSFLAEAASGIEDAWRGQSAVTAFSRLHPLVENHRWLADTSAIHAHGQTVAIDLTLSPEEALRNYNRKLRQELNSIRRAGVTASIDTEWRHMDDFLRLYHDTMRRNLASPMYFFSQEYFAQLRRALGSHAVLMVAALGPRIIAACIFVEYGPFIQAHLEGADEEFLSLSPFKLMIDEERIRGHAAGCRLLHIGGGRGGEQDPLFTVKRRFSPLHFPFFTFRKILNHDAYNHLIEIRRKEGELAGHPFVPNGYFPAYRTPLPKQKVATGETH